LLLFTPSLFLTITEIFKISAWLINVINKQQKNIRHNVLEIILNLISIYGDENKQIEIELMNELTVVGSSLNLDKVILSLSNV
jgi:hypothetical protein